jgi:nucleoid-associated protein YgaU
MARIPKGAPMTGAGRVAATVRLAAWSAALVAGARALVATGRGSLSVPLGSADELADWVGATTPAEMAMAVLRLLAIAACGYLLAVTALGVFARLVQARGLAAAVDRVTPAVVLRIVSGGAGAGLVLGALVASLPAPDLARPPDASTVAASPAGPEARPARPAAATARMARVPPATATMTRTTPGASGGGGATMTRLEDVALPAGSANPSATMTRIDPEPPPEPVAAGPVTVAPPASPALPPAHALPAVDAATWLVEAGDSLWSIAEEVVRTARPDSAQRNVTRYWRALVDANRAHLVDPGNPDLLVPGQQLALPPFSR